MALDPEVLDKVDSLLNDSLMARTTLAATERAVKDSVGQMNTSRDYLALVGLASAAAEGQAALSELLKQIAILLDLEQVLHQAEQATPETALVQNDCLTDKKNVADTGLDGDGADSVTLEEAGRSSADFPGSPCQPQHDDVVAVLPINSQPLTSSGSCEIDDTDLPPVMAAAPAALSSNAISSCQCHGRGAGLHP
jgi:hypothetical protein